MHSFANRANILLTYAGTVLAFMCIATSITDFFHVAEPAVHVDLVGIEGLQRELGSDKVYPVLNVSVDLTSEFSWNTKQLFTFITLDWETKKNKRNSAVMWSAILSKPESARGTLTNLKPQYPFAVTDQGYSLRGVPFNITVAWNVMPRVGRLYSRSQTFTGFEFPEDYIVPPTEEKKSRRPSQKKSSVTET